MDDKTIFEEIAAGWEWLDKNYDGLDETAKAAFDKYTHGTVALVWKYGVAKGTSGFGAGFAVAAAVAFPVAFGAGIIYSNWKEWRKNRLDKTETADSE